MTLYFNGHVTLDTSNGPTQVKIVDGRIVKPEPVELDDPPSDAPWLVADDAIRGDDLRKSVSTETHDALFDDVAGPTMPPRPHRPADPELIIITRKGIGITVPASTPDVVMIALFNMARSLTQNPFGESWTLATLDGAVADAVRRASAKDEQVSAAMETLAAAQPIIDSILGKGRELNKETMREAAAELTSANEAFAKLVADERKRVEASAVNEHAEPMFVISDVADGKVERFGLLTMSTGPAGYPISHPWSLSFGDESVGLDDGRYAMVWCIVDGDARIVASKLIDSVAASLRGWSLGALKPAGSLTGGPFDLGAIAAALAPGEALDLAGIIARASAYRRHSIELAAIRAVVDPTVHTEAAGVDPFPWDAVEVGDPHDRVCVLVDAMNSAADALAKVRS